MNSQTIFYSKRHNITMSQKSKITLSRKEKMIKVIDMPFQWTEIEEKAYMALKVMLTQAPVVQPPDWTHLFTYL